MKQDIKIQVKEGMSIISYRDLIVSFYNTLTGTFGEAYFNFPLSKADVDRLNNLKVFEVFYYSSSEEESVLTYRPLQFYDAGSFRLLLSEFLLFKSGDKFQMTLPKPSIKKIEPS